MVDYKIYTSSVKGNSHLLNEDSLLVKKQGSRVWAGVFDGVSSGGGGDIAAKTAAGVMSEVVDELKDSISIVDMALTIIAKAQEHILSEQSVHPEYGGIKSTAAMVCIDRRNSYLYWFNLGDSAIFINNGKKLKKLTCDDTVIGSLLAQGKLTSKEAKRLPDRARHELVKYLGMDVAPDDLKEMVSYGRVTLTPHDAILLCTDGLCGYTPETVIRKVSWRHDEPAIAMTSLSSKQYGGSDDTTVIVLRPNRINNHSTIGLSISLGLFLFASGFASGAFCSLYVKETVPITRQNEKESGKADSDTTTYTALTQNSISDEKKN